VMIPLPVSGGLACEPASGGAAVETALCGGGGGGELALQPIVARNSVQLKKRTNETAGTIGRIFVKRSEWF